MPPGDRDHGPETQGLAALTGRVFGPVTMVMMLVVATLVGVPKVNARRPHHVLRARKPGQLAGAWWLPLRPGCCSTTWTDHRWLAVFVIARFSCEFLAESCKAAIAGCQ